MSNIYLKKFSNLITFVIILTLIIYLPYIIHGGIIYDDWSIFELFFLNSNYFDILRDWFFGSHYTRPIGSFYISTIGFIFKDKIYLYLINNIIIVFLTALIFSKSISKKYSLKTAFIFSILFLSPNLSSTNIFSPIEQSQGNLANLIFSFSIYFLAKSKRDNQNKTYKVYSYLFIILSLLTYETTIVLIPFFILLNNGFKINFKNKLQISNFKILFPILIFCIFVFLYQTFATQILSHLKLLGGHDVYKFGFGENEFLSDIFKYSYKPITLILIDIPNLYLSSILNSFDFKVLLNSILISILIIFICFLNINNNFKDNTESKSNIFLLALLSYGLLIMIHIAGTSVPDISGYNNRYFVSFNIIFSLCISLLVFNLLKFKKYKITIIISFFIFLILHFNTFITQRDNFTKVHKVQNEIKKEIMKIDLSENSILFADIPTYLINNFNNETIFSTEVNDWPRAVRYWSNKKIFSERIYKDKNCESILRYENKSFFSMRPSRSKRIKNKTLQKLFEKYPENVDLNDFKNFYVFKFEQKKVSKIKKIEILNLNKQLKEIFNCHY